MPFTKSPNSFQGEEHISLLLPVSGIYRAGKTEVIFLLLSLPYAS